MLTHSSPKKMNKRGDHEYAEPLKNASNSVIPQRKAVSDHPYANPVESTTPAPVQAPIDAVKARAARVSSEHSYGTRQRLASIREGDHAYTTKRPQQPQESQEHAETDPLLIADPPSPQNVELVQVVVNCNQQPPPGLAVIAQGPENNAKSSSAKRKAPIKIRKLFEAPNAGAVKTEMNYACEFCGKTFPQPYRKNRHILEVHRKEKRFECQYCQKMFYKISGKKRHELTHVSHDTWKCTLACKKTFKDRSALKYHMQKKVCELIK